MAIDSEAHIGAISQYLSYTERLVMMHKVARLKADVEWHQDLLNHLPEIIADESAKPIVRHEGNNHSHV